MNGNDRFVMGISAGVILAVLVLAGFVVVTLSGHAMVIAAVLTALAGLLAAIPPIIRVLLRDDDRES